MSSLATRHIDYSDILKETLTAEGNRLVPEYVEDYFLLAYRRLGGTVERRGESYHIPSVPFELRRWGDDHDFKTTYGTLFREYKRVTFDKAYARDHPEAEFVAPGHPLLEAVNQRILATFGRGMDNTEKMIEGPLEQIQAEACEIIDVGCDGGVIIGSGYRGPDIPFRNFVAYHEVCLTRGNFEA